MYLNVSLNQSLNIPLFSNHKIRSMDLFYFDKRNNQVTDELNISIVFSLAAIYLDSKSKGVLIKRKKQRYSRKRSHNQFKISFSLYHSLSPFFQLVSHHILYRSFFQGKIKYILKME